jgi:hypothetical protein
MVNNIKCVEFKKNELKTLASLNNHTFLKSFPELARAVELTYYQYKNADLSRRNFSFTWIFELPVQEKPHKVLLGGHVEGDFEETSYYLAICDSENNNELIRKFHFDYANPKIKTEQPVPTFHLQYGGRLYEQLKSQSIVDNYMFTWLSVPRLNFSPINLALILDLLFCEFRTKEVNTIVEDPHWRALVKQNELMLTAHYYKRIHYFGKVSKRAKTN